MKLRQLKSCIIEKITDSNKRIKINWDKLNALQMSCKISESPNNNLY